MYKPSLYQWLVDTGSMLTVLVNELQAGVNYDWHVITGQRLTRQLRLVLHTTHTPY